MAEFEDRVAGIRAAVQGLVDTLSQADVQVAQLDSRFEKLVAQANTVGDLVRVMATLNEAVKGLNIDEVAQLSEKMKAVGVAIKALDPQKISNTTTAITGQARALQQLSKIEQEMTRSIDDSARAFSEMKTAIANAFDGLDEADLKLSTTKNNIKDLVLAAESLGTVQLHVSAFATAANNLKSSEWKDVSDSVNRAVNAINRLKVGSLDSLIAGLTNMGKSGSGLGTVATVLEQVANDTQENHRPDQTPRTMEINQPLTVVNNAPIKRVENASSPPVQRQTVQRPVSSSIATPPPIQITLPPVEGRAAPVAIERKKELATSMRPAAVYKNIPEGNESETGVDYGLMLRQATLERIKRAKDVVTQYNNNSATPVDEAGINTIAEALAMNEIRKLGTYSRATMEVLYKQFEQSVIDSQATISQTDSEGAPQTFSLAMNAGKTGKGFNDLDLMARSNEKTRKWLLAQAQASNDALLKGTEFQIEEVPEVPLPPPATSEDKFIAIIEARRKVMQQMKHSFLKQNEAAAAYFDEMVELAATSTQQELTDQGHTVRLPGLQKLRLQAKPQLDSGFTLVDNVSTPIGDKTLLATREQRKTEGFSSSIGAAADAAKDLSGSGTGVFQGLMKYLASTFSALKNLPEGVIGAIQKLDQAINTVILSIASLSLDALKLSLNGLNEVMQHFNKATGNLVQAVEAYPESIKRSVKSVDLATAGLASKLSTAAFVSRAVTKNDELLRTAGNVRQYSREQASEKFGEVYDNMTKGEKRLESLPPIVGEAQYERGTVYKSDRGIYTAVNPHVKPEEIGLEHGEYGEAYQNNEDVQEAHRQRIQANATAVYAAVEDSPSKVAIVTGGGQPHMGSTYGEVDKDVKMLIDHVFAVFYDEIDGVLKVAELNPGEGNNTVDGINEAMLGSRGGYARPFEEIAAEYPMISAVPVKGDDTGAVDRFLGEVAKVQQPGAVYSLASAIGETCASSIATGLRNSGIDKNFGKPIAGMQQILPAEVLEYFTANSINKGEELTPHAAGAEYDKLEEAAEIVRQKLTAALSEHYSDFAPEDVRQYAAKNTSYFNDRGEEGAGIWKDLNNKRAELHGNNDASVNSILGYDNTLRLLDRSQASLAPVADIDHIPNPEAWPTANGIPSWPEKLRNYQQEAGGQQQTNDSYTPEGGDKLPSVNNAEQRFTAVMTARMQMLANLKDEFIAENEVTEEYFKQMAQVVAIAGDLVSANADYFAKKYPKIDKLQDSMQDSLQKNGSTVDLNGETESFGDETLAQFRNTESPSSLIGAQTANKVLTSVRQQVFGKDVSHSSLNYIMNGKLSGNEVERAEGPLPEADVERIRYNKDTATYSSRGNGIAGATPEEAAAHLLAIIKAVDESAHKIAVLSTAGATAGVTGMVTGLGSSGNNTANHSIVAFRDPETGHLRTREMLGDIEKKTDGNYVNSAVTGIKQKAERSPDEIVRSVDAVSATAFKGSAEEAKKFLDYIIQHTEEGLTYSFINVEDTLEQAAQRIVEAGNTCSSLVARAAEHAGLGTVKGTFTGVAQATGLDKHLNVITPADNKRFFENRNRESPEKTLVDRTKNVFGSMFSANSGINALGRAVYNELQKAKDFFSQIPLIRGFLDKLKSVDLSFFNKIKNSGEKLIDSMQVKQLTPEVVESFSSSVGAAEHRSWKQAYPDQPYTKEQKAVSSDVSDQVTEVFSSLQTGVGVIDTFAAKFKKFQTYTGNAGAVSNGIVEFLVAIKTLNPGSFIDLAGAIIKVYAAMKNILFTAGLVSTPAQGGRAGTVRAIVEGSTRAYVGQKSGGRDEVTTAEEADGTSTHHVVPSGFKLVRESDSEKTKVRLEKLRQQKEEIDQLEKENAERAARLDKDTGDATGPTEAPSSSLGTALRDMQTTAEHSRGSAINQIFAKAADSPESAKAKALLENLTDEELERSKYMENAVRKLGNHTLNQATGATGYVVASQDSVAKIGHAVYGQDQPAVADSLARANHAAVNIPIYNTPVSASIIGRAGTVPISPAQAALHEITHSLTATMSHNGTPMFNRIGDSAAKRRDKVNQDLMSISEDHPELAAGMIGSRKTHTSDGINKQMDYLFDPKEVYSNVGSAMMTGNKELEQFFRKVYGPELFEQAISMLRTHIPTVFSDEALAHIQKQIEETGFEIAAATALSPGVPNSHFVAANNNEAFALPNAEAHAVRMSDTQPQRGPIVIPEPPTLEPIFGLGNHPPGQQGPILVPSPPKGIPIPTTPLPDIDRAPDLATPIDKLEAGAKVLIDKVDATLGEASAKIPDFIEVKTEDVKTVADGVEDNVRQFIESLSDIPLFKQLIDSLDSRSGTIATMLEGENGENSGNVAKTAMSTAMNIDYGAIITEGMDQFGPQLSGLAKKGQQHIREGVAIIGKELVEALQDPSPANMESVATAALDWAKDITGSIERDITRTITKGITGSEKVSDNVVTRNVRPILTKRIQKFFNSDQGLEYIGSWASPKHEEDMYGDFSEKVRKKSGRAVDSSTYQQSVAYDYDSGEMKLSASAKTTTGATVSLSYKLNELGKYELETAHKTGGLKASLQEMGQYMVNAPFFIMNNAIQNMMYSVQAFISDVMRLQGALSEMGQIINTIDPQGSTERINKVMYNSLNTAVETGNTAESGISASTQAYKQMGEISNLDQRGELANRYAGLQMGANSLFGLDTGETEARKAVPAIYTQLKDGIDKSVTDPAKRAEMAMDQLEKVFAKIIVTSRETGTSAIDIITIYTQLATAQKNVGASTEQILAIIGTGMSRIGKTPEETGAVFRAMMDKVFNEASDSLQKMYGIKTKYVDEGGQVKNRGYDEVFTDLASKANESPSNMSSITAMIGGQESRGYLAKMFAGAPDIARVAGVVGGTDDTAAYDSALKERQKQFDVSMTSMKTSFAAFLAQLILGSGISGDLGNILKNVTDTVQMFTKSLADNPEAIAWIKGIAEFIGVTFVRSLTRGFNAFAGLSTVLKGIQTRIEGIGASLEMMWQAERNVLTTGQKVASVLTVGLEQVQSATEIAAKEAQGYSAQATEAFSSAAGAVSKLDAEIDQTAASTLKLTEGLGKAAALTRGFASTERAPSYGNSDKFREKLSAVGETVGSIAMMGGMDLMTGGMNKENGTNIGVGIAAAFVGSLVGPMGTIAGYTMGKAFSEYVDIYGQIGTSEGEKTKATEKFASLNESQEGALNKLRSNPAMLQSLREKYGQEQIINFDDPTYSVSKGIRRTSAFLTGNGVDETKTGAGRGSFAAQSELAAIDPQIQQIAVSSGFSTFDEFLGFIQESNVEGTEANKLLTERKTQMEQLAELQKNLTGESKETDQSYVSAASTLATIKSRMEDVQTASSTAFNSKVGLNQFAAFGDQNQKLDSWYMDRPTNGTADSMNADLERYKLGQDSLRGLTDVNQVAIPLTGKLNQNLDLDQMQERLYKVGPEGQQQFQQSLQPMVEMQQYVDEYAAIQKNIEDIKGNANLKGGSPEAKAQLEGELEVYEKQRSSREGLFLQYSQYLDLVKSSPAMFEKELAVIEKQSKARQAIVIKGNEAKFQMPNQMNVKGNSSEDLVKALDKAREKQADMVRMFPEAAKDFKKQQFLMDNGDGGYKAVTGINQSYFQDALKEITDKKVPNPNLVDLRDKSPEKVQEIILKARTLQDQAIKLAPGLAEGISNEQLLLLGKNNDLLSESGLSQEYLRLAMEDNTKATEDTLRGHYNLPGSYRPPTVWDYYNEGGKEAGDQNFPDVNKQGMVPIDFAKNLANAMLLGDKGDKNKIPDLGVLGDTTEPGSSKIGYPEPGTPDKIIMPPSLDLPDGIVTDRIVVGGTEWTKDTEEGNRDRWWEDAPTPPSTITADLENGKYGPYDGKKGEEEFVLGKTMDGGKGEETYGYHQGTAATSAIPSAPVPVTVVTNVPEVDALASPSSSLASSLLNQVDVEGTNAKIADLGKATDPPKGKLEQLAMSGDIAATSVSAVSTSASLASSTLDGISLSADKANVGMGTVASSVSEFGKSMATVNTSINGMDVAKMMQGAFDKAILNMQVNIVQNPDGSTTITKTDNGGAKGATGAGSPSLGAGVTGGTRPR